MSTILLTGATGFIGKAILQRLLADGLHSPIAVSRQQEAEFPPGVQRVQVADIDQETDWSKILKDVNVVIHTAARAHVLNERLGSPLSEFRRINVEGTLNLARQAATAKVRRFIFISSIGVNGNQNTRPFTESDTPCPVEPYAVSKYEAEQGLFRLAEESGMEVVSIRPPLVYGPDAPGNFGSLIRWVRKGIPLPLGAINNLRSFVSLDNLVDLIVTCVWHPAAANQVFMVSDGEDLSTTDLLRRVAAVLGKPARLVPVPQGLLELSLMMLGKGMLAQRLCGSLRVDSGKAGRLLGWRPPLSLDEGLKRIAPSA